MEAIGLYTNKEMILTGIKARNAEDIMRRLCDRAMQMKCIEPVFITALLERKKSIRPGFPQAFPSLSLTFTTAA